MPGQRLNSLRAQRALRASALVLAVVVGLGLSACSGAQSGQDEATATGLAPPGATQTSEGGQVTVKVTWTGVNAGPVFTVVMDTHSVDLDRIDLRDLAVLRTDDGREVRPNGWDAPKGGHHREGNLTFPTSAEDGSALLGDSTQTITLTIRDVAGVPERSFQWSPRTSN